MSDTERRRRFQTELGELIERYTDVVGSAGDPDELELEPLRMPVLAGWVLVVDWTDLEPAGGPGTADGATALVHSGLRQPHRIGLLALALEETTADGGDA